MTAITPYKESILATHKDFKATAEAIVAAAGSRAARTTRMSTPAAMSNQSADRTT